ncbi:hypothetical protein BN1723_013941 [Verticillium longisporum]|nr:Zinc-type alcohol dehydrogenase-like protein C16A3.02c [Verticillium dahliae VDG2]KAF3358631.1 Protein phosphatase PP2A regulatory subunit A [Verticillium dahliae VDG1]RBQ69132.1 hypothetical protein VDGD_21568 [Verticillium dahliae]CRK27145.1 hypothetical protein BN1723_013941 [Verticillium longisporum]
MAYLPSLRPSNGTRDPRCICPPGFQLLRLDGLEVDRDNIPGSRASQFFPPGPYSHRDPLMAILQMLHRLETKVTRLTDANVDRRDIPSMEAPIEAPSTQEALDGGVLTPLSMTSPE